MSSTSELATPLDITGITSVEAATYNGDLIVELGDVRARVITQSHGDAHCKIERVGNLLYIVGKKKGLTYGGGGVTLSIFLPSGLPIKLANVGGAIFVHGHPQYLQASTVNGPIILQSIGHADLQISTVNGAASISDSYGHINTSTVHGDIHLARCEGLMELSLTDGQVMLSQLKGEIQLSNGYGKITGNNLLFAAASQNWINVGGGEVILTGIESPDGLDIHIQAPQPSIEFRLPNFTIQSRKKHFHACLAGNIPANLEIIISGSVSIIPFGTFSPYNDM
jgi:hypothetical protein